MYSGADNGLTETYMMPGTGPNPQVSLLQPLEGVDYMTNEMGPEVIYDQGLYYPPASYYGYYCTGIEPQSEWDDHRFFGLDGQELHYPAFQTENSSYVYFSPSYGYAQSAYNPYNPYIPGAVMGVDDPNLGTQQYLSNPSYQLPAPSPTAYVPLVVQPNSDAVSTFYGAPSVFDNAPSISGRQAIAGVNHSHSRVSTNGGATIEGSASRTQKSESSRTSSLEASMNKQPSLMRSATSGGVSPMSRGRTGLMQVPEHSPDMSISSVQNPSKGQSNILPNFGSSVRGWAAVDRFRPRFQYNGVVRNGNGSTYILGEQNKGPRTNRSKGQWPSEASDGAQMSKAGTANVQEAIVINADQYNKDDFLVNYPDAKFFVIKSYSEDDVHKSIKYNVWSSTPNGNKRLHSAYGDAQRVSTGKPRNCPIFLFFSVNASGQFCGVAEMIGPVDFNKDMDCWQQDKWTGCFPVKWHIIKDVPNTSFRHIVLENNENKPVTNSRDTQEITYVPGMNMLNIFKGSPLKTSILDDFLFYEERQKIMHEEKSRFTGRTYSTYVPAIVSANKTLDLASKNDSVDQSAKKDEVQLSVASHQLLKADGNKGADNLVMTEAALDTIQHDKSLGDDGLINHRVPSKSDTIEPSNGHEDVNPDHKGDGNKGADILVMTEAAPDIIKHEKNLGDDGLINRRVPSKSDTIEPSNDQEDVNPDHKRDADIAIYVAKMKSLSVGSSEGGMEGVESSQGGAVVRSMHVKVNEDVDPTSDVITTGSIPDEPKAVKFDEKGTASDGTPS